MPDPRSSPEVLAIIPARGGSRSLPRKNIAEVAGRPLIEWSVLAAQASESIDRVLVSTDDREIGTIARKAGAEMPFLRPAELAQDTTPDHPVFLHALEWLSEHEGYEPDLVVHLRPTSPVRPRGLIDEAVALLASQSDADSVRSVCEPEQNPFKMWSLRDRYLEPLIESGIEEAYNRPRQELPPVYWQNGTVDVARRQTIRGGSMTGERILALVIDRRLATDIDDLASLEIAERRLLELADRMLP